MFAFKAHGRYPITSRSYWDLVDHPSERSDAYRTQSTEGSILYPLLAAWAAARGEQTLFDEIAKFSADALGHCTFQTWLPDEDSEDNLYLNRDSHGAALVARHRITAIIAKASMTRDTWRCQPCHMIPQTVGSPYHNRPRFHTWGNRGIESHRSIQGVEAGGCSPIR